MHVMSPKNIVRLGLLLAPLHPKIPTLAWKNGRLHAKRSESPKQVLLAGELYDGGDNAMRGRPPKGYIAVYVGPEMRRFVIPASYLSMPEFGVLMEQMAEEFGFEQEGGLRIPCEEDDFEKILLKCVKSEKRTKHA
ncbi:Small auxin-up RNA [Dillenia turbinata]|uniref:Small auxin-up RNA n=1 Tax=Dillenia turbinata TaxID=194707 RepID=A0AAN8UGK8_9MAGN